MRRLLTRARDGAGQRGAIILFVLFVAVAIAVLAQALSVAIISAERAKDAENTGRDLLAEKGQALLDVREGLLAEWAPHGWSPATEGSAGVSTMVEPIADAGGWALDGSAAHPADVSPIVLSAWVERGRDGLDLPIAGLVAQSARWAGGRETPCVEMDQSRGPSGPDEESVLANGPAAWLVEQSGVLPHDAGLESRTLARPWGLDDGWKGLLDGGGQGGATSGLRPGPAVTVLHGKKGVTVAWPQGLKGEADSPVLVVVIGGAELDAAELGDVYAVIVCDGGGVALGGTRIHGGVFASGGVDFGSTGAVLFAPDTVRWAADCCLLRARLVPGSRREVVE